MAVHLCPFSFELVVLTTAWPPWISGRMLMSHSIVSLSRTVRLCGPWGGRWIGHWKDSMVDGLLICATLTGGRGGHTPFVQTRAETPDTGAEAVKSNQGYSWEGCSGGWGRCQVWKCGVLWSFSAYSALHWYSAQCTACMLLLLMRHWWRGNEVDMRTAAPNRSAVLCSQMDQG